MLLLSNVMALASAAVIVPFTRYRLMKRGSNPVSLEANGIGLYANFSLGGQVLRSQIDTGSSDIWVAEVNSCQKTVHSSCGSTYNPRLSSSFSMNRSDPFLISYADRTGAQGFYAQETLEIGGSMVTGANFALATRASADSVFGIGLPAGEAIVQESQAMGKQRLPYDNLPMQMKYQGIIHTAAYSVWLGQPGTLDGELNFGGIDHSKYTGDLITFPIEYESVKLNADGTAQILKDRATLLVLVNKLAIEVDGKIQTIMEGNIPALLDTGSTISHFPESIIDVFSQIFGVSSTDETMSCGVPDGDLVISIRGEDFQFPLKTFSSPVYNGEGQELALTEGYLVCNTGFQADSSAAFLSFGDNILRALYLVYDFDHMEISLAQVATSSNEQVEDILSTIPRARQAKDYSTSFSKYSISVVSEATLSFTESYITSIDGDGASRTIMSPKAPNIFTGVPLGITGLGGLQTGLLSPGSHTKTADVASTISSMSADKKWDGSSISNSGSTLSTSANMARKSISALTAAAIAAFLL